MISMENSKVVRDRFSRAADRYEHLAFIQNDIRRELVERLATFQAGRVLDVGCGTGALLSDLAEKDPRGYQVGIDVAWGMAHEAHMMDLTAGIVQADAAALPFAPESFDQVVSSSSYQWVTDLSSAFSDARRVLKTGGKFQAVLFGRETLGEFFKSLGETGISLELPRLPSPLDVHQALDQAGFSGTTMSHEIRETIFRDMWSLLVWVKSIGANNLGRGTFLGRDALLKAQEHYGRNYGVDGGIRVSFEVIWIDAKK